MSTALTAFVITKIDLNKIPWEIIAGINEILPFHTDPYNLRDAIRSGRIENYARVRLSGSNRPIEIIEHGLDGDGIAIEIELREYAPRFYLHTTDGNKSWTVRDRFLQVKPKHFTGQEGYADAVTLAGRLEIDHSIQTRRILNEFRAFEVQALVTSEYTPSTDPQHDESDEYSTHFFVIAQALRDILADRQPCLDDIEAEAALHAQYLAITSAFSKATELDDEAPRKYAARARNTHTTVDPNYIREINLLTEDEGEWIPINGKRRGYPVERPEYCESVTEI